MPIIVACPSCAGQLRVADDLIGRKVRCPACSTTFDVRAPSPPPAANDQPVPTEKVDGWKFINLELSDAPAPGGSAVPQPEARRAIDLDSNDRIPIPPAPLDPPARRSEQPPRLNDDNDDMLACGACGRLSHRDARRCHHCGERFDRDGPAPAPRYDEDDDQPRGRSRRQRLERRDTEPHRGGFVLAMGIVSLALLAFCPLVGVVPGLIAWICGQRDLRKMRDNTMDPEGEGTTQAGWICGIIGSSISLLCVLLCSGWIGLLMYVEIQSSRNMARPPVVTPMPAPGQRPGKRP